jgi:hypothetical protein
MHAVSLRTNLNTCVHAHTYTEHTVARESLIILFILRYLHLQLQILCVLTACFYKVEGKNKWETIGLFHMLFLMHILWNLSPGGVAEWSYRPAAEQKDRGFESR